MVGRIRIGENQLDRLSRGHDKLGERVTHPFRDTSDGNLLESLLLVKLHLGGIPLPFHEFTLCFHLQQQPGDPGVIRVPAPQRTQVL